jgi:hypothetical protein
MIPQGGLGPLSGAQGQQNKLASAGGLNFANNQQMVNKSLLMSNQAAMASASGVMTNNFLQ